MLVSHERLFKQYGFHAARFLQINHDLQQPAPLWQKRITIQLTNEVVQTTDDQKNPLVSLGIPNSKQPQRSLWVAGLLPQNFQSVSSIFAMDAYFTNRESMQHFFALMAWLIVPSGYLWGVCVDGQAVLQCWLSKQMAKKFPQSGSAHDIELPPSTISKCRLDMILKKSQSKFPVPRWSSVEEHLLRIPFGSRGLINGKEHVLFEWSHIEDIAQRCGFWIVETHIEPLPGFVRAFAFQKRDASSWMVVDNKEKPHKKKN